MNKQIYEEAAQWLVELRTGDIDAAARARLDGWFRTSPEHIRAFLELSHVWEEGGDKELSRVFSRAELIGRARAVGTNVVVLDSGPQGELTAHVATASDTPAAHASDDRRKEIPSRRRSTARMPWGRYSLAASTAFLVVAAALTLYRSWPSTYTTGIGDERTVTLADGSKVELDARSRIHVRFSKHERDIDLLDGQALFYVAKDASRPFIVTSDEAHVRAVGTQFDVYRKSGGTTAVTVIEGRVAVLAGSAPSMGTTLPQSPGALSMTHETDGQKGVAEPAHLAFPGASPGVLVSAGEQVIVTAQQISKPENASIAVATAWTRRELVFDEASLTDVAAEFNLYNKKPLIMSDGSLKDFHVTGVFSSTDPSSLLRFLRAQKGIRVQATDKGIVIGRQ
jgi:transmembrane sensor